MEISKHISYYEAIKSNTATSLGIENSPDADQLKAMQNVAQKCFEPLRNWYGKAIGVSSFLRSHALNKAIRGSKKSQHVKGEAIDIDADIYHNGITNKQILEYFVDYGDFDQLISEYPDKNGEPRWVHVSCRLDGNNRGEVLVAEKVNGRTQYRYYEEG